MAILSADFEAGSLGANVTTGAGEASLSRWEEQFNSFATYDGFCFVGSQSAKFPGASVTSQYGWTTTAPTAEVFSRCYLYMPSFPAGNSTFTGPLQSGSYGALIGINSGGQFRLSDALGALTASAGIIPLNQWVRFELHAIGSATVGQIEVKLFRNPYSIIPDDVTTTPATRNTLTPWNDYRFVCTGFGQGFYLDQIVVGTSAYIGPYPKCSSVPLIHGTFTVGSTVTCDGGLWNDAIRLGYYQGTQYQTLTYQWKRDGVDIAGQTGQTYTLASGDVGHYIQCKVTAVNLNLISETANALSAGIPI